MFAPICHAFKIQLKLHNSADHGISKFLYLRFCLVVCFYPQPPTWPWLWGRAYLYLPVCSMLSHCFLSCHFEDCSFNSHLEISLPFFIVVSKKRQQVYKKLPYFPWDFNKIITSSSRCLHGSHWIREMKGEGKFRKFLLNGRFENSLLFFVVGNEIDVQKSIKSSLFSLKLQQDHTTIL